MKDISVYCKDECIVCTQLKNLLKKENIEYKEINIFTPAALTELRFNRVFTMSAPVLQIGKNFYTTNDICIDPLHLDQNKVIELLK